MHTLRAPRQFDVPVLQERRVGGPFKEERRRRERGSGMEDCQVRSRSLLSSSSEVMSPWTGHSSYDSPMKNMRGRRVQYPLSLPRCTQTSPRGNANEAAALRRARRKTSPSWSRQVLPRQDLPRLIHSPVCPHSHNIHLRGQPCSYAHARYR